MIWWKGWGILVPVIWLVPFLISRSIFWDGGFILQILFWLLNLVPMVAIWFLGRRLNNQKNEVYIEPGTGNEKRLGYQHTFMFIPFEYWAIILFLVNIWW